MKLAGFTGTGQGKMGSAVFRTVAGEQIVAQYQPRVANPNTAAQVEQRAKLKLMSQVAAALSPVIAIPREGLKSSRNLFVKKNFSNVLVNEGEAIVTYENLQLTNGHAGLPGVMASRSAGTGVVVSLRENPGSNLSRVVYILYTKSSEQKLQYVSSVIVSQPGLDGLWQGQLPYINGDLVIYAYGMNDLNAAASANYDNYIVQNGSDMARLIVNRTISTQDYQLTQTRGVTLFAGENETATIPDGSARVFVSASGPGTVSGAGIYEIGQSVTVVATPQSGMNFIGWRENGSTSYVSREASYTFTLSSQRDLIAVFSSTTAPTTVVINTQVQGGTNYVVTGAGEYNYGAQVTLSAPEPLSGVSFEGWKLSSAPTGVYLTTNRSYTFTANESATYVAVYSDDVQI